VIQDNQLDFLRSPRLSTTGKWVDSSETDAAGCDGDPVRADGIFCGIVVYAVVTHFRGKCTPDGNKTSYDISLF